MKAAVVYEAGRPPAYREFPDPEPQADEEVVDIVAAGLHQITRSQADGRHYTSSERLPKIPGTDGVARKSDGTLVYCGGLKPPYGTFAERAAVAGFAMPLPAGADPQILAASLNPGASGWLALTVRAGIQPGQTVAVLGATGAAGRTAVQAAKLLGAGRVIAVGRSASALEEVSEAADQTVRTTDDASWTQLLEAPVDIVLDYVWGEPTTQLLPTLSDRNGTRLAWVQIGSTAGPTIPLAAEWLRRNDVQLMGSGLGSASMRDIAVELPTVIEHIAAGRIRVEPVVRQLSDVETAWNETVPSGSRMIFLP